MNMSTQLLYNDFPTFLRKYFPYKVQKISLNAGFTCPNRDGTKGWGGCTYCNNQTFNPDYCRTEKSITTQLEEGKCFFAHKYPEMKYLAYFQAYTNTYAELEGLKRKYEEALTVDGVVGLVIGTRPDCMPESLLRYLEELNKHTFLMVEYGIESTCDETLKRINRGHTYADTVEAVRRTAGNSSGDIVPVQFKQFRMRPGIGAVHGHIDGDVAYNADAVMVGIGFQLIPLPDEFKLEIFMELNVIIQFPPVVVQGILPAQADVLCPPGPGSSFEPGLYCHEKGVILQPPSVFIPEFPKLRVQAYAAPLIGFSQQGVPLFVDLCIVHKIRPAAEVSPAAFFLCKDAFLYKVLQTNEIGIACKGGKGLVGGIPVTGGPQGENLPVGLAGLL